MWGLDPWCVFRHLMDDSDDILQECFLKFKVFSIIYIYNENVEHVCRTHEKPLHHSDGNF